MPDAFNICPGKISQVYVHRQSNGLGSFIINHKLPAIWVADIADNRLVEIPIVVQSSAAGAGKTAINRTR